MAFGIDELSGRVGVSTQLLRAWDLCFGLLHQKSKKSSATAFNLQDEARIFEFQRNLSSGMPLALAAQLAQNHESTNSSEDRPLIHSSELILKEAYDLLQDSLDNYDEPAAQAILDGIIEKFPIEIVLREVFLSYLEEVGRRWQDGTLSVGQEHFASNVLRGRLSELARGWGNGPGPTAVLACIPGEIHEFGLMISGILLHRDGWSIKYLGGNTPIENVIDLVSQVQCALVVLTSVVTKYFNAVIPDILQISSSTLVVIAGRGATNEIAGRCGAVFTSVDPVSLPEEIRKILSK